MTVASTRFAIDPAWSLVLADLGVSQTELLENAGLRSDLFMRKESYVTADEYYGLWESLEELVEDPAFALHLASSLQAEAFSPAVLACLCSANLNLAMTRLAHFKLLCVPMRLDVQIGAESTTLAPRGLPGRRRAPVSIMATELVFITHIARRGTRKEIKPVEVVTAEPLPEVELYERYFGAPVRVGDAYRLTFSATDAREPFLTENSDIWNTFEPELTRRLNEVHNTAAFRDRVQKCLAEIIAGGSCDSTDVASRLGVSVRTLQRRLTAEGTNFQKELNALRERLARHYLDTTQMSNAEVAFLLGYEDPNSFIRAFNNWTGRPPEKYRANGTAIGGVSRAVRRTAIVAGL